MIKSNILKDNLNVPAVLYLLGIYSILRIIKPGCVTINHNSCRRLFAERGAIRKKERKKEREKER